jgi:hypothetical protein
MLNSSRLLSYIKGNIGFPWQFIELTDAEILEYNVNFTLKEFAHYFPDVNTIGLNLLTASNKVPGKANEYYITDPDGREILNVCNIYFSGGNLYLFGQPPIGPMSVGELPQWALNNEMAGWVKSFSSWNYTIVFRHPNIVSIRPTPTSEEWCALEYEREHAEDFSTITNELQMYFCELCLADIMLMIGRIRKKYSGGGQGIPTPFGNIPLDDSIMEEGKERKTAVIEKLTAGALTNVTVNWA